MNLGRILIIAVVLGIVGCVACVAFIALGGLAILNATQPVVDASDDFLNELKAGDYAGAYAMMTPALQSEVGSAEDLQTGLGTIAPDSWSITSRNIESNNGVTTGSTGGTLTAQDGTEYNFSLVLAKDGDDWLISGFDFQPQGE